jgi:hypothetical protein
LRDTVPEVTSVSPWLTFHIFGCLFSSRQSPWTYQLSSVVLICYSMKRVADTLRPQEIFLAFLNSYTKWRRIHQVWAGIIVLSQVI